MIIRNGVIGVDYKSLDIDMIGAVDVSVNVIDKIKIGRASCRERV